jgi:hypothetical protein
MRPAVSITSVSAPLESANDLRVLQHIKESFFPRKPSGYKIKYLSKYI